VTLPNDYVFKDGRVKHTTRILDFAKGKAKDGGISLADVVQELGIEPKKASATLQRLAKTERLTVVDRQRTEWEIVADKHTKMCSSHCKIYVLTTEELDWYE
jgi:Mn-dependent DtxR family transcriptional regulator